MLKAKDLKSKIWIISQWSGSAYPDSDKDLCQNLKDPQHWLKACSSAFFLGLIFQSYAHSLQYCTRQSDLVPNPQLC